MSMKFSKTEYVTIAEKTEMPFYEFLQYINHNYTQYREQEIYDFYLKTKARRMGQPLFLQCELTADCNLDCKMCYSHIEKAKLKKQMLSTEQWLEILSQAVEAGISEVYLTGGEAMLHPGFWEIYEYLHFQGVEVSVFTNGLCLTADAVERLKKLRPKEIQISVYGTNDLFYEAVTGHRVFKYVNEAINRVLEAQLPLKLAITPSRQNYENIDDIVRYAQDKACKYRINFVEIPVRKDTGRDNDNARLSDEQYCVLWKRFHEFKEAEKDGCTDEMCEKGIACSAGQITCHIDHQGMMNGCVNFPIADACVLEEGFIASWQKVHKKSNEYRIPAECTGCEYYKNCFICAGEHCSETGESLYNKDKCQKMKLCFGSL